MDPAGFLTGSFEPIIQGRVRPFAKAACKAALAPQPGKITRARAGNDKPFCRNLTVLDGFLTLKHERTLASVKFSTEPLHADEAGRTIVQSDLQSLDRGFAIDISGKRFAQTDFQ